MRCFFITFAPVMKIRFRSYLNLRPHTVTHMGTPPKHIWIVAIVLTCLSSLVYADTAPDADRDTLRKRGVAYMMTQRYSEALDCLSEAMELYEPNSTEYYSCLGNIASVYGYMGNLERSLYYQLRVYEEAKRAGERDIMSEIIINLVGTYCSMHDLENARRFFSLQLQYPHRDVALSRYYFLYNQALLAQLERKYDVADYYHREAVKHALKRLSSRQVITQYIGIANNGLLSGRTDTALLYANKALALANSENNIIKMRDAAALLERIYRRLGDENKARDFNARKTAYSDSIFNRIQFDMAQNKLFEHEHKVNEERVSSLSRKIDIRDRTIIAFIIVILTLAVFTVAIVRSMRKLRNSQRLLILRNEELMRTEANSRRMLEDRYAVAQDMPDSSRRNPECEAAKVSSVQTEPNQGQSRSIRLEAEQIREIADKINLVMQDMNMISRPDFSLNMLAESIGSNSSYVSFVINDTFGKNFRSLLNEHRIREACRRLSDSEHYGNITIQAIYQQLGYSSPGSFIDAFKKINGMTPSVYQKLARQVHDDTPQ